MREFQITEDQFPSLSAVMRSLDIFALLSADQMTRMLWFVGVREYDPGEAILAKGDVGDAFFAIHSGKVEVQVPGFLGRKKVLNRLGPGDFFGELALLLHQPRNATIVCVEPTQCFVLRTTDFELMMERNSDIAALVKTAARRRV